MKTLSLIALIAFSTALLISWAWTPVPYEERLVQLQVEQMLPAFAADLRLAPIEVQAQFVEYADDRLLVAKAHLALLRYPEMTGPIVEHYGDRPEFKEVLGHYGESVIPPIHYFLNNEVRTVQLMRKAGEVMRNIEEKARRIYADSKATSREPANPPESDAQLTAEERGLYAIRFIQTGGHSFLGQFVVSNDGKVHWVQSERALEAANSFFLGGIRTLETKYRLDQEVELKDVGWAVGDLLVGFSGIKLVRLGRAAAVIKSERNLARSHKLLRISTIGGKLVKYGAPVGLAYLAVRYPSLLNSLLKVFAEAMGLPVWLVQVAGWTMILMPVLYIIRLLLRPSGALLVWLGSRMRGIAGHSRVHRVA